MSLNGLTVMVTRPRPQGEELCEQIKAHGGKAIYFPTIEIMPMMNDKLKQSIAALDQYDMVIFVSPNAVLQSAPIINSVWPLFPPHLQVVAIGKSTAQSLAKANLPVHYYPTSHWNSESLLDAPLMQHVQDKRIVIIQGETGRQLLIKVLSKRGAYVENMIAYRRVMPTIDIELYTNLLKAHEIDIIICTSNEILQNLTIMLNVKSVPMMVISDRMLSFAKNLGLKKLYLAKNASHDAIMSELFKQKDHLCQMKKTNI